MKISKKEKYLLLGLGAVFIGLGYYYLLFTPQSEKLAKAQSEKTTLQNDYDTKTSRIKNLNSNTEKAIKLFKELCERTEKYYPTIMQEKIILEIDKFMQDSQMKGDLSFEPTEVTTVEKIGAPYIGEKNGALGEIVDSINEKKREETYSDPQTGNSIGDCKQLKVSIKFRETSYDSLKKFILALENYDRKISINELSAKSDKDKLTGTITLEFYGVAQLDGDDDEYLRWTIENIYGKEKLFSTGVATGANGTSIEDQAANGSVNDFAMILRAPSSELPSLTMGKSKDETRQSYIHSDIATVEDVTIEFQEENGELFYKYRTSSEYYPKSDSGIGEKFTPVSGNIVLEITSERRMGDSDTSGINLKIINNTSKNVNVVVKNDDETNPRVKINSEGNSATSVTKK